MMMIENILPEPGLIILFGSGETSPSGRKVFERVMQQLPPFPRIALLETPAGFELNSSQVIGRVGDFFCRRLRNFSPQVEIVPARKRGTPFSPDEPSILEPLLKADIIFMGPGSPSYAVRQLEGSLAWNYLVASHRLGTVLALASAATVALSTHALPVYEIYKVGEDIHWIQGLDFFRLYGLQLVFVPHWNNYEGGAELDTSRCFMGEERFALLLEMLPREITIVGIDENTALLMDLSRCICSVMGKGKITILHTGHAHLEALNHSQDMESSSSRVDSDLARFMENQAGHFHQFGDGEHFSMDLLGSIQHFQPEICMPPAIWQNALRYHTTPEKEEINLPGDEVMSLIKKRNEARLQADWLTADDLRERILQLGWEVLDTEKGPVCRKRSIE